MTTYRRLLVTSEQCGHEPEVRNVVHIRGDELRVKLKSCCNGWDMKEIQSPMFVEMSKLKEKQMVAEEIKESPGKTIQG